jgi:hypothetical protein
MDQFKDYAAGKITAYEKKPPDRRHHRHGPGVPAGLPHAKKSEMGKGIKSSKKNHLNRY